MKKDILELIYLIAFMLFALAVLALFIGFVPNFKHL